MARKRIQQIIIATFMMFALFVAAVPSFSDNSVLSEASFGFCDAIGSGMKGKSKVDASSVIDPSAPSRKWTIQELFGGSLNFTTYYGEGEESWFAKGTGDRMKETPGWDDSKVKERVEGVRSPVRCAGGGLAAEMSSWPIAWAGWLVDISKAFTTRMLSGSLICTVDGANDGMCINILGIIGGENGSEGIIGSLRESIFSPLATAAFLMCAIWLLYKGLFKREFRASLMGVLWSIAIFVVGFMLMQKPQMLAGLPQTINSSINTCIVGAINGQNCITGSVTAPSTLVGKECQVSTSSPGEGAAMAANSMNCAIWKSFVMDGWAKSQFGLHYDELYLADPPANGSIMPNAPDDVSRYGVNLKSSGSAKDYINKTVETSSEKVTNLALYQMYISTDMKSAGDPQWNNSMNDPRWFNVVVPVAKNPSMWNNWAPLSLGIERALGSIGTFIIAGVVSFSLIAFSFYGLVYMLAGTLLMAFAPFFFLLAIEPSKGRRMFLGWLEAVVSSILKFMASSLFVIVALTMYSAILSSTSGGITAFIGISIMVGVLTMYRKEIVNILGMSSLGGQRFSNAVGDKINRDVKTAKEFATVSGGSAVGAVLAARGEAKAAGVRTPVVSAALHGAADGFSRQQRRGQNFMGGVARQQNAVNKATSDKIEQMRRDKEEEAKLAEESANKKREDDDRNDDDNIDPPVPPHTPDDDGGGGGGGGGGSGYTGSGEEITSEVTDEGTRSEFNQTHEEENDDPTVPTDTPKYYSPYNSNDDLDDIEMKNDDFNKSVDDVIDNLGKEAYDDEPSTSKVEITEEITPNVNRTNQFEFDNEDIAPDAQEAPVTKTKHTNSKTVSMPPVDPPELDIVTKINDGKVIVEGDDLEMKLPEVDAPVSHDLNPPASLNEEYVDTSDYDDLIENMKSRTQDKSEYTVNHTIENNSSKKTLPDIDMSGKTFTNRKETKKEEPINKFPEL